MKKLLMMGLAAFAFTVAECREKTDAVQVPDTTIVAAFIDLQKAYDNGKSVASTLIDALPSNDRSRAKKQYEEALTVIDKFNDALDPEWAVVTFGGSLREIAENKHRPEELVAVVLKVNADEDDVKKVLKDVFKADDVKSEKRDGHIVFLDIEDDEDHLGLIDSKYIIISHSKNAFDEMVNLYAGKGWGSKDFNDLARISGDTVCRISTAPVASLLTRFELSREIEKFGEACEDQELADMLLNMRSISLDIGMAGKLSLALHVACNSPNDAKMVESLMRSAAFLARIGCDICAFGTKNRESFNSLFGEISIPVEARDVFINLAHNVEADRSWTVATLSVALETAKLAEFIVKWTAPVGKGKLVPGAKAAESAPAVPASQYATTNAPASYYGRKDEAKKDDSSYSSYRRDAQIRSCISNMKMLQTAAEMYMLNHSSTPTVSDLCGPGKYLRKQPTCPKDGSFYEIRLKDGAIEVRCGSGDPDHVLPDATR